MIMCCACSEAVIVTGSWGYAPFKSELTWIEGHLLHVRIEEDRASDRGEISPSRYSVLVCATSSAPLVDAWVRAEAGEARELVPSLQPIATTVITAVNESFAHTFDLSSSMSAAHQYVMGVVAALDPHRNSAAGQQFPCTPRVVHANSPAVFSIQAPFTLASTGGDGVELCGVHLGIPAAGTAVYAEIRNPLFVFTVPNCLFVAKSGCVRCTAIAAIGKEFKWCVKLDCVRALITPERSIVMLCVRVCLRVQASER